ncbi:MAG: methylated-DNA--[protein]-cysteine S-methyltransferase [Gemmatimonadaceae bacterium]|nr:methylated-DNA--[protein]-cysteine S-methyltransferase [Gemmatimonadaceae bacterium]NUQ91795.1 methylated-DNA--[protein]-cysteine S-methyltransferase [Gemmatimonadaceae bacterium]NUR18509.1 methylated-DNA--[protein]-cysteine S-methyltransferase [Gemmatimonadaceae bacterium]
MRTDYDRIELAIQYLDERSREQPSLAEVAAYVGLSESHFQRLFTRWAGISPKRFLQFQTVAHARALLAESRSLLDATYEAGLSSAGRLHDLFVTIDAVTPGEFKRAGDGLTIEWGTHDTPFGECVIGVTSRGICGLYFATDGDGVDGARVRLAESWEGARFAENARATRPLAARIFGAVDAGPAPLAVLVKGTNLQLKVWEALLRIPLGELATYEQVAAAAGAPRAVRAVGNAVGQNPVSYLIPCHRVIRKTGAFGNYGGGIARKRAMLAWEFARREGESGGPALASRPEQLRFAMAR